MLFAAVFILALSARVPATAATGCSSHADSLFATASTDYQHGKYVYTSADMQEAATDYYACAQHAKKAGDPAKYVQYEYFYGESLYVAGEAEAKLHHNAKVEELWSTSLDALKPLQKSQYLDAAERGLASHSVKVMGPTVKLLSQEQ
jgi:hypothetical protein